MTTVRYFKHLLFALLFMGCSDVFEYSPNQVHDNDSPKNLNENNLLKLTKAEPDDTVTVVFIGDSQQFYDEVEVFVTKVNQINNVDFVLVAGDISDYGLLQEFEWVAERLNKLKVPYFAAIGNHDLVANGERAFQKMFGLPNASFVYDSVKFILHNTNSREYRSHNVPDLDWLAGELSPKPDVQNYVAVSHVPPFSSDFNPALVRPYTSLFADTPGFLVSLHGHVHAHSDTYPYEDGVRYITSDSFEQRRLVLLKISGQNVAAQVIPY